MRGGQVVALILALLLLLPGLCFLAVGAGMATDTSGGGGLDLGSFGIALILIAIAILGVAALLFWLAFRKPKPDSEPKPPQGPSQGEERE
jgi:membrane protein implicated in regulation of membrane protease activity